MEGSNIIRIILFSFVGGWVSGAFGLGGGAVFNPLLLSFGVPPSVASSTGMYMIIFATLSSTIQYCLSNLLDLSYSLWVGSWCVIGTLLGMALMDKLMRKLKRESPLVFLLSLMLGLSAVAVVYFGLLPLDYKSELTYKFG